MTRQETINAAAEEVCLYFTNGVNRTNYEKVSEIFTKHLASKEPVVEADVDKIAEKCENALTGAAFNCPAVHGQLLPKVFALPIIKQAIAEATAPLHSEIARLTELLNEGVGMRESRLEDDLIAVRQKVAELEKDKELWNFVEKYGCTVDELQGVWACEFRFKDYTANSPRKAVQLAIDAAKEKEGK